MTRGETGGDVPDKAWLDELRPKVGPDTPLRMDHAAKFFFPDGSMTKKTLMREFAAGRLAIYRIAGKIFTTQADIQEMQRRRDLELKAIPSVVYFIQSGEYLKIGISTNVTRRLAQLRQRMPHPAIVLHTTPGGTREERALHRRFRALHHTGEWFRYEGELVEFVESLRTSEAT